MLAKSFAFYKNRSEKSFEFYKNSNVIELHPSNFDELVLQSDQIWVVQFYAEWCYYSKRLISEYKKLATILKYNNVNVGAMEAHGDDPFYNRLNLKGFPTIKVFNVDKSLPIYYKGNRTAEDIANFVDELIALSEDEPKSEYDWSSMETEVDDNSTDSLLDLYSKSASGKVHNKLLANLICILSINTQLFVQHIFIN